MQGVRSAQLARLAAVPPAAFPRNAGVNEMGAVIKTRSQFQDVFKLFVCITPNFCVSFFFFYLKSPLSLGQMDVIRI